MEQDQQRLLGLVLQMPDDEAEKKLESLDQELAQPLREALQHLSSFVDVIRTRLQTDGVLTAK